jgi:predicted esterase
VLIAQGTADELVAPAATRALAEQLCRLGDTVELRTYQDVNHDIFEVASADVVAWIADRLAGRSARSTCRR